MAKRLIVAIDGPAGSGKSTVTHMLAKKLGYTHIDTGALYRAIAYKALDCGIGIEDGVRLGELAQQTRLQFKEGNQIHCDGKNVAKLIRTPEISMAASKISAYPEVRSALLGFQREMGKSGGVVLEGRDIGTVVFPNAEVKFFLTASVDSRARRRMIELEDKGTYLDFDEVKKQVVDRDKGDTERKIAPLKKASDALEIDSTNLTVEQVVETLEKIVKENENK